MNKLFFLFSILYSSAFGNLFITVDGTNCNRGHFVHMPMGKLVFSNPEFYTEYKRYCDDCGVARVEKFNGIEPLLMASMKDDARVSCAKLPVAKKQLTDLFPGKFLYWFIKQHDPEKRWSPGFVDHLAKKNLFVLMVFVNELKQKLI